MSAAQREHNRAWVRHAEAYGATHVTVWFARDEFDDPTEVEVPIRKSRRIEPCRLSVMARILVPECDDGRDQREF